MRNKRDAILGLSFLFIAAMLLLYPGSAVTSSLGNFTVTPDSVSLNWTGTAINITSVVANNSIYTIQNWSTAITSQYFDQIKYQTTDYPGYDTNWTTCFSGATYTMQFIVQNAGTYTNATGVLNQGNSSFFNLTAFQFCPPGLYNGTFNVTKNGTAGEYANVTASINIPVNPINTFSEPNSNASVKGTLAANSNLIHKYYFNTSIAQNLTGVTINLSSDDTTPMDLDLYLFNSTGNLLARSVENGSSREEVYKDLPGTPDIWSIWILGNVTPQQNYQTKMYFSTLNATNATSVNQKISSINFGDLDAVNSQSSQVNITLSNIDTSMWSGVLQKSEIYRNDTWNNRSAAGDYYFLVPAFATKVKVKVEWTGGTNWTISLNSTNAFLGNSSTKHQTGNLTGTVEEENILYTGAFNMDNDGLWKITIGNTTAATNNYSVTAQVWVNPLIWLSSNPSSGLNFNTSTISNNVSLSITLPLPNITNGNYNGFVDYYYPGQWITRIPISFTVRSGTLLINNTLYSDTETKYDNIGFNRLDASALQITLPINNTGGYDINFTNSTSNYTLWKDSVVGSSYMNFTVGWPSSPIEDGSNATIKINISINTNNTADSVGTYYGWVLLNTTNAANASSTSYPSDPLFYIHLRVNLWSNLTVNITGITPTTIAAPANATNMTYNITVHLINGTIISANQWLNQGNFNNIKIVEGNGTSSYSSTLQNLMASGSGVPFGFVCPTGFNLCVLNGTLSSGVPGGNYYATAGAGVNTNVFGGTGVNLNGSAGQSATQVIVNDMGLRITVKSGHLQLINEGDDLYEGQSALFTVNVRNYGPVTATNAFISMTNPYSCKVTILQMNSPSYNTSCNSPTTIPGLGYNITLVGYSLVPETCNLTWKVTALTDLTSSDTGSCDLNMGFASTFANFGNLTITVNVHDNTTSTGDTGAQQGQTTCTSNTTCGSVQYCKNNVCTSLVCPSGWAASNHKCSPSAGNLEITSYTASVRMLQGGSNSTKVTVKNNGGYTYTTKLEVLSPFDGLTPSVSPASYSLGGGNSGIFTINFSVSETAEIGYHIVTIRAYTSENSSIYTKKNITIAVEPLEETKEAINKTSGDLKNLFVSITTQFNQIPPSTEANYTLANRTYYRLLSMFQDVDNYIKSGDYLSANSLLVDANASLAEFKQQVSQISAGGGLLAPFGDFGGTVMLAAILVVIIVIGGFLAYLLLPSKKASFRPAIGFAPKQKTSIVQKIKSAFSKIKRPKFGGQKNLVDFKKTAIAPMAAKEMQKPADKKIYPEGFHRLDQFPLEYDKNKLKEKK